MRKTRLIPLSLLSAAIVSGCVLQPWDAYFEGETNYTSATGMILDTAGRPIITGLTDDADGVSRRFVAKYSTSGQLEWEYRLGDDSYGNYYLMRKENLLASDSSSGILVATQSLIPGDALLSKLTMTKLFANGEMAWSTVIDNALSMTPAQVAIDSDNNHWLLVAVDTHYQLHSYNSAGALQWQISLAGQPGFALDAGGSIGDELQNAEQTNPSRELNTYQASWFSELLRSQRILFDTQGNAIVASGKSILKISPSGDLLSTHSAVEWNIDLITDVDFKQNTLLVTGLDADEMQRSAWLDANMQLLESHTHGSGAEVQNVAMINAEHACFLTAAYTELGSPIQYKVGLYSQTEGMIWEETSDHSAYHLIPGEVKATDDSCYFSHSEQATDDYKTLRHFIDRYALTGEKVEVVNNEVALGEGFELKGTAIYSLQNTDALEDPAKMISWLARHRNP